MAAACPASSPCSGALWELGAPLSAGHSRNRRYALSSTCGLPAGGHPHLWRNAIVLLFCNSKIALWNSLFHEQRTFLLILKRLGKLCAAGDEAGLYPGLPSLPISVGSEGTWTLCRLGFPEVLLMKCGLGACLLAVCLLERHTDTLKPCTDACSANAAAHQVLLACACCWKDCPEQLPAVVWSTGIRFDAVAQAAEGLW